MGALGTMADEVAPVVLVSMRSILFVLFAFAPALVHAHPIRFAFDAIVVSPSSTGTQVGDRVSGNFWYDTHGRVHRNILLGFPGRDMGYTILAPAQSGGIRVDIGPYGMASPPVMKIEVRDYNPRLTGRADELSIFATTVFGGTGLVFRGHGADFLETASLSPHVPRFGTELLFLNYSYAEVRIHDKRRASDFVARVIPATLRYWSLTGRRLLWPDDPEPPPSDPHAVVPEPTTGLLVLLGLLGMGAARRRRAIR